MDLTIEATGDSSRLVIRGGLTVDSVGRLKAALVQALENENDNVSIDLSGASEIDFSCFQVLCSAHRSAAKSGKKISIHACSGSFGQAARQTGLFPHVCRKNTSGDCLWAGSGVCGEIRL